MTEIKDSEFNQLKQKIQGIEDSYWPLLDKMEERIESLEILFAQLIPGHIEVASAIEVILAHLNDQSPEESAKLQEAISNNRKKMMDLLSPDNNNANPID